MFSNVFQISYHVQITAKFRRAGINLCIPIYIGTVALRPEEEIANPSDGAPLWPPSMDNNNTVESEVGVREKVEETNEPEEAPAIEAKMEE